MKPPKINKQSDWWWLVCVSNQSIVIFTFDMLLVIEIHFSEVKKTTDSFTYRLWLQIWLVINICQQKSTGEVTGDVFLVCPTKELLCLLLTCYWWMEIHFLEVKKTLHSFTYGLCCDFKCNWLYLFIRKIK